MFEGRVFVLKQAKFLFLSKHRIREIENIIKLFVNNHKLKAIVNYNIMKLPKEFGGMGAPDIKLNYETIRTRPFRLGK